jgi:transposase
LEFWIDWQCEKNGVPIIVIDPKGTSITCRICNSKLVDNSYRKMKCLKCRFEADRDVIAIQNIERKAKM